MAGRLTLSTLNNDTGVLATQNGMNGIAKAWVSFNGTNGSMRANFNVSSVTRNGTGDYTVNFATAMPDVNYAIAGSTNEGSPLDNSNPARVLQIRRTAPTTSASRFGVTNFGNTAVDVEYVYVIFFSL
jgi:hypothetical protein